MDIEFLISKFSGEWKAIFEIFLKSSDIEPALSWYQSVSSFTNIEVFIQDLLKQEPIIVNSELIFHPRILLFTKFLQHQIFEFLYQNFDKVSIDILNSFVSKLESCKIEDDFVLDVLTFLHNQLAVRSGLSYSHIKHIQPSHEIHLKFNKLFVDSHDTTVFWKDEQCTVTGNYQAVQSSQPILDEQLGNSCVINDQSQTDEDDSQAKTTTPHKSSNPINNFEVNTSQSRLNTQTSITLESLKSALNKNEAKNLIVDFVSTFNDDLIENTCKTVLPELPLDLLPCLCEILSSLNDSLSFKILTCFIHNSLISKIQTLEQNFSRLFYSVIKQFLHQFPLIFIESIIVQTVKNETYGSVQCDLICRLMVEDFFKDRYQILFKHLVKAPFKLNNFHVETFQVLLNYKVNIEKETLRQFISLIHLNRHDLSKDLKFCKLILSFLSKYGEEFITEDLYLIEETVECQKTFLRKSALLNIQSIKTRIA